MGHGQMIWQRDQAVRLVTWGIRFFLTAALTASKTPGGYAPFALGCVAAAGPGGSGLAALAGAGVGAVLFLDFADALPFLATAVLIFTTSTALRGIRLEKKRWFPAAVGVALFLAVGGIYVIQSLDPLGHVTDWAAAAILLGAAAWYDLPLLQAGQEHLDPDSLLVLGASLLLALGDLTVMDVSLGRGLLCLLVLFTAYQRGAVTGAAAGMGIGLAADFCTETGAVLCGAAYGLGGLLAGTRTGRRRSVAAVAFVGASLLALLPAPAEMAQPLLAEVALGGTAFLLLPGRLFGGKRVLPESAVPALERLKSQLTRTAAVLRDLYDSMGRGAPVSSEENPAIIFDRAAEKVCRGCALCDLCWQKEYTGTFNALNDATPFLLERGRVLPKDFPGYFADRCIHLPDFLTAVNGELTAFLLRRQYRRQLEETRRDARGQYAQLSELLTATAAGLGEARAVSGSGPAAQGGGERLRGHGGVLRDGDGAFMSAAGGRHGLWGSGPEGVHSGLPAGAPVPGGGHRAGGSPQNPQRRHVAAQRRDRELYHHRPAHLPAGYRRGGLLQVRSGAQLSEKGGQCPADHRRDAACGTSKHSGGAGRDPGDAGPRQFCGPDQ